MKRKIELLLAFLLLSISCAFAQKLTVKGTVLDETGQTIIGATVREKGVATNGASTDMDGHFTLTVNQGATIVVSYVGYKTQEVKAAAQLTVKMVPDNELLDEVIVVAYGTAKKESFTGSAAVVDSKSLSKAQAPDAVKALQGKVPGLQLSNVTGAPGSESTIRLRGVGSINASSSPLIILNGAPYDGNINSINTRDIENISVLKDAASAALYGARGANGVIIITTKNGRKGTTSVELDARFGVNQRGVPEYDRIMDPGTYYTTFWEAVRNDFLYREENPLDLEAANASASKDLISNWLGYNIYDVPDNQLVVNGALNPNAKIKYQDPTTFNDWASKLMSPKMRQEYNLSITRGQEDSSTFFSLGYLDDKGYAINTGFQRLSSRLSYNTNFNKWLRFQASSQLALTSGNFGAGEDSQGTFANIFFFTRAIAPIYPLYVHDVDGKIVMKNGEPVYDTGDAVKGVHGPRHFSAGKNIVGENELNKDQYNRLYLVQNARADVDLTHGFKFNTTFTYGFINNRASFFINPSMGDGVAYGGILTKNDYQTTTLNWNQILTYDKKVGDFTLQGMLGHESYSRRHSNMGGEKKNTLDPYSLEFNTYAEITSLNSGGAAYAVEGYFGQFTGDYMDKYYLSASLRRDATSVFAPDTRWGTFWSLGASWRVSQEEFMQGTSSWLDNLKLRTSVGQQGNDNLYDNDGYRMYTPYTNLYSIGSDGSHSTFSSSFMGNPDITWEKNLNVSAGLESSLFNHRLNVELDFFMRHTTDMLFNEPVSKTTGFTFQPKNIGSMRNIGFEFNVSGTVVRTEDVMLTLGVNGMTYKNKILALPERFKEEGLSSGVRILKEGGGIYDIYQVKFAGVNPENGDALYYKHNDTAPEKRKDGEGDFIIVGSEKYRSEIKDRQFIGSAIPKLEGGFFTNLNAYGFDLGLQFTYRWGGIIYDNGYSSLMHTGGSGETANAWHKDILNRWTPENKNTNVPRLQTNNQKLLSGSDMFLVDASYLSLSNITLGYTLPQKWTESLGLQTVRLYGVGDNLFLLSQRKGLDPRTSLSGASAGNRTSAIRTISGGVSITF